MVNGTVLGVAPIKVSLFAVAAALSVFCTVIKPEASAGLALLARFGFWVTHVGTGLAGILLASALLRFWPARHTSLPWAIAITGAIGTLIALPGYLALEAWYPSPSQPPDDWLDDFAMAGWWQAAIAEYIEVLPSLLTSWYLVNLPLLLNRPVVHTPPPGSGDAPPPQAALRDAQLRERREQLLAKLPEVVGCDIVAISSDLHYLNVHTALGKTLVLGSLKYYAEAFGDQGLLVHRSNWVAKRHVVRVHSTGGASHCLMSTGLKVPVSRSRRKAVKACFGSATLATPTAQALVRVK